MKRPQILPVNPVGIHFQKASLILVLFFIHGEAWINQITGHRTHIENTLFWKIVVFFGMFNVLLPCTAGAILRLDENAVFDGWRLRKFDWKPVLWVALGLGLAESLKAACTLGFEIFFGWDVLHLIAISMLLILALARISILAVWVSIGVCVMLTPWLREWLLPFQVDTAADLNAVNGFGLQNWFVLILAEVVFALLALKLARARIFARKYKLRIGALLFVTFLVSSVLAFRYQAPPYFTARLINLPVGILVGDQLGLHYWPFFPWYAEIAFGYVFFDLLLRVRRRGLRWGVLLLSLILEALYFQISFPSMVREYDPVTGWSATMFRGSLSLLYINLAIFSGLTVFWDFVARAPRARRFLEHHPRVFHVAHMFSRTILFSYIFMNSLGMALAYPFAWWLPYPVALIAFPVFTILVWLFLGQRLLDFLSTRSLVVHLKSKGASHHHAR